MLQQKGQRQQGQRGGGNGGEFAPGLAIRRPDLSLHTGIAGAHAPVIPDRSAEGEIAFELDEYALVAQLDVFLGQIVVQQDEIESVLVFLVKQRQGADAQFIFEPARGEAKPPGCTVVFGNAFAVDDSESGGRVRDPSSDLAESIGGTE